MRTEKVRVGYALRYAINRSNLRPIMYILSTNGYTKYPLKQSVFPLFLQVLPKMLFMSEFCLSECREKPKIDTASKFSNFKIIQMPVIFINLSVLFFTA